MCASQTIAVSAPAQSRQRSSQPASSSIIARISGRIANGRLRPGFASDEKTSPIDVKPSSPSYGDSVTSRSSGSDVSTRRGAALARHDVAAGVVLEQDRVRVGEIARLVLRLAVRAHDALVAAHAHLVLGRDAARELERRASGQHHRRVREHDQNAARAQAHRGERVEVALRADVDAGQDQVHLAATVGERDEPAHDARGGVEILGAAVHRDARARGDGDPLDRQTLPLGQVEGRDDAVALGRGERAHVARRIAGEQHAAHALGVLARGRGDHAEDDTGVVQSRRAVTGSARSPARSYSWKLPSPVGAPIPSLSRSGGAVNSRTTSYG